MIKNLNNAELIQKLKVAEERIAELERDLARKNRMLGEYQQTEHEFQEREQKLHKLLEILPVGISILDAQQNIVYSNPALQKILQINQEGLLNGRYRGRRYLAAHGAPMSADGFANMQVKKRGEPVYDVETGIVTEAETVIWTSVSAIPVDFSDWKIVLTTSDITARKQAEEERRRSEERFSKIFHASPVPMVIGDAETAQIIEVNQAYERLVEYDRNEIVGHTPFELDTYADKAQVARAMHDLRTQGGLNGTELTLHTKSGEVRNILAWSQLLRLDNQQMINLGTAIDVTAHKLVEQSLRDNEARYRSLFENLPVAIWEEDFSAVKAYLDDLKDRGVTDLDAYLTAHKEVVRECVELIKVTDVNQAALSMYEASNKAELLGSLVNTFSNDTITGFKDELLMVAKGELGFRSESLGWSFNGDQRDVVINWIVQPGYEQTYGKVLVTLSDITDLRQAQEKYQEIFENSAGGIFQTTPDGRFLSANPALARIYGYDSTQELIESVTDISHQIYLRPEDREEFIRSMESKGAIENFESKDLRKDGRIIWTSTSARAVRAADGKILYYEGFLQDITERKQAEQALADNEKRFRAMIENGLDDISLLDAQGHLLWESPSVVRNLGYVPDENIGRDMFDFVHPEDRTWTNELFAKLIHAPGSRQHGTFRLRHANGSWRWVEGVATNLLDEPSVRGVVINYRDITERQQAEEARNEAELRYHALFEQSHDAIFILDLQGRHLAVNQRAADMLGYSRQDLLGLSVTEISAEPAQSKRVLRDLLNGQHIPIYERLFRKKDGSTCPVEINAELVRDTHGNPLHIQSVVRDITDRRHAEIELQHRTEDLGLINAINEVIVQGGNLEGVIDVLTQEMSRLFSSRGTSLYMLSPDARWLTMQKYAMSSEVTRKIEKLIGSTVPIIKIPVQEGGLFQRVLQSGRGILVSDPKEIQNWLAEFIETEFLPSRARRAIRKLIPQIYKLLNINSTILVPLISNGKVTGFLDVSSSGLFTIEDLRRIENIGRQLTAAIQRQEANERIQRSEAFLNSIQNALSASIAILDETGTIVRVNAAWRKFGKQNGLSHPQDCLGMNYLAICDSASGQNAEEAPLVAKAIREVITGQRGEAWVEYPCHSPEAQRWFSLRITKFEDGDKIWVMLAHENITQRKQAQDALQWSESLLAQAGKMAHLGAWEIEVINPENPSKNTQRWSDEVYRIFGYEPGQLEVKGNLFLERVHPEDRHKLQNAMSQAIAEKRPYEVEHRIIRLDGLERIVEERADLIFDQHGQLVKILGAIQDVTERKLTERTLRETSEQFRTLFEASPEAIMLVDPHGDWPILDCNATACSMNGYTREELIGHPIDILNLSSGDAAGRLEYLEQVRNAGILRYEDFHRHKDGSTFPIEVSTSLITLGGREVVLGIDRDITERKKAEDALRQSEQRYHALFEDMPIAIWEEDFSEVKKHLDSLKEQGVTDFRAYFESHPETLLACADKIRILDVNNTAVRMYHASSKEQLLRNLEGSLNEIELRQLERVLINISEGQLRLNWEGPDQTFTGEQIEVNLAASVTPGHEQDYSRIIFTTVDITEHKNTEAALRESEEKYRLLFDSNPLPMWIFDLETLCFLKVNAAAIRHYGYSEVEFKSMSIKDIRPPQDVPRLIDKIAHSKDRVDSAGVWTHLKKDGSPIQVEIISHEVEFDGRQAKLVLVNDITERIQAEEALYESEQKYRNLVETSHDLIWSVDGEGRITYLNQASKQIYGYEPEELIGHSFLELMDPKYYPLDLEKFRKELPAGDKLVDIESVVRHRDGRQIILSANSLVLRDENNNVIRVVGSSRDITERKQVEEDLRRSETRYRLATKATNDVIWEWDATTHQLIWSENAQVVFGYSAEEIGPEEKWWDQHLHPDDVERILPKLNDFMSGESSIWSEEYRFLRQDGSYAHINDNAYLERDVDGNPLRMIGAMSDITERKQAEEQLRKLSRAVEQSASSIVITDTDGQIEYVNPKFTAITGYTSEEALGQNPRILKSGLTPPDVYEGLWQAIASGKEWHGELQNRKKNRELYWETVTISPILNDRGEITHFVAVKEDITERKQNEADTRRRADEFAALYETARDLATHYHLPTLLNTIVERARVLLSTHGGGIYLYDEARDDLEMVLAVGSPIPTGTRIQMGEGIAGRVAQTQQRLIVDDYHVWAGRSHQIEFESVPFRAVLEVPMLYGGKLIGVLVVHELGESERKFTEVDAHLLSLFAEYAASAVHAARLLQETRRRAEETTALLETSVAITSLDLNSTLQIFGDRAQSLFDADGCRIFLMEPDGETLRCVLALQETPEVFSDLRIKLGVGVTGAVAASGRPEIVNDMQNDPRALQIAGTPDEEEAIMFAPLKERDRTIGVLSVRRIGTQRPFQPSDLVLLEAFASMAASAVSNARLFEETQRRLAEMEALYVNGLAVGRLLEPRAIGERIIRTFAMYLSWHHVTIRLCKDDSDELELIAFHLPHLEGGIASNEEQRFKRHVSRVGQGLSGWVVQTGNPIRTSNLSEEPHYVSTYTGMQSGLYMPLKVGDRVIGVISVESEEHDAFSEQDERLLATLANQAATALENARLYQSAQQEIWERKIAEEALRQSEENYRRLARELEDRVRERTAEVQDLYDNAPCGYHSLDPDGRIIRVNQTELNWLGYPQEEVLGHSILEFITDESRTAFRETFPTFKEQGSLRDFELEMLRKDGSVFPILVSATAIYDKEGRYLTSRSTLFDDTERKQAMETLRLANTEMKRAMRMKDEFLANMSHELRTPLNAILGLSESLLEQTAGPINEKQQKYLGTVNESGRHLLELINDILDLAKIESGQIKLDPGKVNINTACETSLRMVKQLAQKKNQTVEVEIEKEIGHVWADDRRLKQMLVNLLSNAVKFTPADGQLGLKARVDRKDMKLLITIWDRGIGIHEDDLKRLFRPFVQLDSSLSRESAGTGLGLALVAEMARLHGGSISVSSQPGYGSEFTIILPWDPAITADTLDKLKVSGKIPIMKRTTTEKQTILLVEDTESVVLMLRDYLELSGYKVQIARNGLEGVSKSMALRPDLILMDVQMPGLDGLEATRRIRKESSLKKTPIIALTALAMPSDRERCLEAGMSDYLSKPINFKELAKTVLRHLADSETVRKS